MAENVEISEITDDLIPTMNVSMPSDQALTPCIITDDDILETFEEIVSNLRDDRKQVDEHIDNFSNLVMNEGDSTSSSKEALVNLIKIKTDISDKMAKIADLKTRIKLKDKDTFPRYLAAKQENHISYGVNRAVLEDIHKNHKDK